MKWKISHALCDDSTKWFTEIFSLALMIDFCMLCKNYIKDYYLLTKNKTATCEFIRVSLNKNVFEFSYLFGKNKTRACYCSLS